jgi:hypothetical protein
VAVAVSSCDGEWAAAAASHTITTGNLGKGSG